MADKNCSVGMEGIWLLCRFLLSVSEHLFCIIFFFSSRRRHTRWNCDWSSDVCSSDLTGRAEFVTLEGEHRKIIRGWDFKIIVGRVLGWNVLKSSRFEVSRSGSNFIFRGSGFGHGLGLCQEGAHVMAARGASYHKILEKYFPGITINVSGGSKADVLPGTLSYTHSLLARSATAFRLVTISSEHFSLAYPADADRRLVNQILNTLELTRSDYLRRASSAATGVNIPRLE